MPLPLTGTVALKSGKPKQAWLPNRSKVIVPVGLKPPESVAVSVIGLPIAAVGVALVTRLGVAPTATFSPGSSHGVKLA